MVCARNGLKYSIQIAGLGSCIVCLGGKVRLQAHEIERRCWTIKCPRNSFVALVLSQLQQLAVIVVSISAHLQDP